MVLIDYITLNDSIKYLVEKSRDEGVAVSIDQVYNNAQYHLELNRVAGVNFKIIGEAERPGFPPLKEQIKELPDQQPLVLVDDGIFSGDTLINLIDLLVSSGRQVNQVIVGLDIQQGEREILKKYPQLQIKSAFKFNGVIDWVCERDFCLGVPLSGRTVGYRNQYRTVPCYPDLSLPYCLPFGDPQQGASIPPEKAKEFSMFVLKQSIKLWSEIERLSKRKITCADIPRLPFVLDENYRDFSFVEFLIQTEKDLK